MKTYGQELILDLHSCDSSTFNRKSIRQYFKQLCDLIDMEPAKLVWWDYYNEPELYKAAPPHLKGTSAVQFIKTSNIVIHTLDTLGRVYLNIFSCKDFSDIKARDFSIEFFVCKKLAQCRAIERI